MSAVGNDANLGINVRNLPVTDLRRDYCATGYRRTKRTDSPAARLNDGALLRGFLLSPKNTPAIAIIALHGVFFGDSITASPIRTD